jgi:hypothetical protein
LPFIGTFEKRENGGNPSPNAAEPPDWGKRVEMRGSINSNQTIDETIKM